MVVPRGVRRVSGFAYSNLLSPSVPFWRWLPWYRRLGRFAKDAVRRWQTSRLDLILCETEYWADRARGAFPGSRVAVVEMAPGQLILDALAGLETQERVASESPGDVEKGAYRLLYLSGPHPNKRIHELASVLRRADELVDNSIRLVLTLPPSDPYTLKVLEAFSAQDSLHLVENVGPIGPREVARELRDANLVLNTAAVESFSNNWVEAWASATPLVTTDAAWTRDACGNAAVFIDLDQPADAAGAIAEVLVAAELRSILIANGRQRLERLPSPAERAKRFEAFVREVSNES